MDTIFTQGAITHVRRATRQFGDSPDFRVRNKATDEMTEVDHDSRVEAVEQWSFPGILVAHAHQKVSRQGPPTKYVRTAFACQFISAFGHVEPWPPPANGAVINIAVGEFEIVVGAATQRDDVPPAPMISFLGEAGCAPAPPTE
ncbi:hypothetical protein D3C87_1788640 [compost metagenome]